METSISSNTFSSPRKEEPSEGEEQMSDTDDSLTELRAQQARKRPFPPGCPVLCVTDNDIILGRVARVFIDIACLRRSFVYHVTTKDTTILVREEDLQWAPGCPVWLYPTSGPIWKECTILTSYQASSQSGGLFSLRQDSDGALFHGYPQECIRYRDTTKAPEGAPVIAKGVEEWYMDNISDKQHSDNESTEPCPVDVPPVAQDVALDDDADDMTTTNDNRVPLVSPSKDEVCQQRLSRATEVLPYDPYHDGQDSQSEPDQEECQVLTSNPNCNGAGESGSTSAVKRSMDAANAQEGNVPKRVKCETTPGYSGGTMEADESNSLVFQDNHFGKDPEWHDGTTFSHGSLPNEETRGILDTDNLEPGEVVEPTADDYSVEPGEVVERTTGHDSVEYTDHDSSRTTVPFRVPDCIFRNVNEMKDFERENCFRIMEKSKCQIRLFTEYVTRKGADQALFDLTGTQEEQHTAVALLQRALLARTAMKQYALYYFAYLNGDLVGAQRSGKLVHQRHCGSNKRMWMYGEQFPQDFPDFGGFFIGKHRSRIKQLKRQSGCLIFIDVNCEEPYWVVYGDTENRVRKAIELIAHNLNYCRARGAV